MKAKEVEDRAVVCVSRSTGKYSIRKNGYLFWTGKETNQWAKEHYDERDKQIWETDNKKEAKDELEAMAINTPLPAFGSPMPGHVSPEYVIPYLVHGVDVTTSSLWKSREYRIIWSSDVLIREVITGSRKMKLRPLSDLINEIEHGKEKFFPVNYWEEHIDRVKIEDELVNMATNNYCDFHLPYCVMQKLIEWRFDVFGLIGKNLAEEIKA